MLWFEARGRGALTESPDQPLRSSVEAFVDGSLRDMPEHLRAVSRANRSCWGAMSWPYAAPGA